MDAFSYNGSTLYCEDVPVQEIVEQYGTPVFIYSESMFRHDFAALDNAFQAIDHTICFAVKANSNLSVLKTFAELGAGFDIVSAGELYRVIQAGGDPGKAVFAGVGKTADEIRYALENDILFFSIESEVELHRINLIAESMGKIARFCIRVNPDVDPKTHKYITTGKSENKFGLDFEAAQQMYAHAQTLKHVEAVGVQMHIGSQITTTEPYITAVRKLTGLVRELRSMGVRITYIDIGGGLGIVYRDETPPTPEQFATAVLPDLQAADAKLILEPGRFLCGNAGIMVTTIQYVKNAPTKDFAVVDAGMNDLIRPSLYQAYHDIVPVTRREGDDVTIDIVGPICESSDTFGQERTMPPIEAGDCLAVKSAGAYGFVMASNYNTRPRAAEVMVSGSRVQLVRRRETWKDLIDHEISCSEK
jgi:diaminopimelate decarboxylase